MVFSFLPSNITKILHESLNIIIKFSCFYILETSNEDASYHNQYIHFYVNILLFPCLLSSIACICLNP